MPCRRPDGERVSASRAGLAVRAGRACNGQRNRSLRVGELASLGYAGTRAHTNPDDLLPDIARWTGVDADPAGRSLPHRGAAGGPASSYAPSSFLRQPEPKKLSARRKSFTFPGVIGHQLISDFMPKRSMTTDCCAQNLRMPPGP